MQIELFTEDSGTTAEKDSVERVSDFFRGGFLPIKDLSSELAPYGDVSVHILSEKYGYIRGSDPTTGLSASDHARSGAIQDFLKAITKASRTADVIVILLTESAFEETVVGQWDTLVSNTRSNSIWCIGASQSAVSAVDIARLQSKAGTVIVYERVGVARISTECKDELIEKARQASTE